MRVLKACDVATLVLRMLGYMNLYCFRGVFSPKTNMNNSERPLFHELKINQIKHTTFLRL